jgi:GNAT superfamily N-acetyltransferase
MFAITQDLSRRSERAAAQYLLQRYCGPDNPMGTQVLRIGDTFATKVPFLKGNALMNSVHHLEDPALLPEILAFYAATEQPCWVTVPPYLPTAVANALCKAGFHIERYASSMLAEPVPQPRPSAADVREIARAELDVFLDTLNAGFGSDAAMLPNLRRNQRFWCDVPDWHLFLARVDGAPAGAGVLSIHGDIGYLAAASVLPAWRGRGLQSALIAARLARAKTRRCTVVCCGADWGSQSQRNLQRAGLAIAHVKTIWTNHSVETHSRGSSAQAV